MESVVIELAAQLKSAKTKIKRYKERIIHMQREVNVRQTPIVAPAKEPDNLDKLSMFISDMLAHSSLHAMYHHVLSTLTVLAPNTN